MLRLRIWFTVDRARLVETRVCACVTYRYNDAVHMPGQSLHASMMVWFISDIPMRLGLAL